MKRTSKESTARKKKRAIARLVAGYNYSDTAAAVGVSPVTLARWRKLPKFQAALNLAYEQALDTEMRLLVNINENAILELSRLMRESDDERVRMNAADKLHTYFASAVEKRYMQQQMEQMIEKFKAHVPTA